MATFVDRTDFDSLNNFLKSQNFPEHLIKEFNNALNHTPIRFVVLDNGGSMTAPEGTLMVVTRKNVTRIKAPKFDEAKEVVEWQLKLCEHAKIKTHFIFTTNVEPILVDPDVPDSFNRVRDVLASPAGGESNYDKAFDYIEKLVAENDEFNKKNNFKAAVIVVSDGQNLRIHPSFQRVAKFNTQMVFRVTTDRWSILRSWNAVDADKSANIDVLDNFFDEAKEVSAINPWLTYSYQLHHLRESGVPIRGLDSLDEDKFTGADIRAFIAKIYGNEESIPYPDVEGASFVFYVDNIDQLKVYDPIDDHRNDWIKVHVFREKFRKVFGVNMN